MKALMGGWPILTSWLSMLGGNCGCGQAGESPPKRSLDGAPLRFKRTRKARLPRQGVCVIWKLGAGYSAPNRHKVPRLRSG
jgi:hypothetical protein